MREMDRRIAEDAGVPLNRRETAAFNLLEKARYFGIEDIAQLDTVVRRLAHKAVLMSHYLRPQDNFLAGSSLDFVFEVMAAELGSLEAATAYYDSLQYTFTPSRAWAEGVIQAYEQVKMYEQ